MKETCSFGVINNTTHEKPPYHSALLQFEKFQTDAAMLQAPLKHCLAQQMTGPHAYLLALTVGLSEEPQHMLLLEPHLSRKSV